MKLEKRLWSAERRCSAAEGSSCWDDALEAEEDEEEVEAEAPEDMPLLAAVLGLSSAFGDCSPSVLVE